MYQLLPSWGKNTHTHNIKKILFSTTPHSEVKKEGDRLPNATHALLLSMSTPKYYYCYFVVKIIIIIINMSNPVFNQALQHLLRSTIVAVHTKYGSDEWHECLVHAQQRCEQLAVNVTVKKKNTTTKEKKTEGDNKTEHDGVVKAEGDTNDEDADAPKEDTELESEPYIPDLDTSLNIMGPVTEVWGQRGGPSIGSPWSAITFCITYPSRMTLVFEPEKEEEEENDKLQKIHDARFVKYANLFGGPLPDIIIKLNHLFVVWSLGGPIPFTAPILGDKDNCILTTFGLTNSNMPAKLKTVSRGGNRMTVMN